MNRSDYWFTILSSFAIFWLLAWATILPWLHEAQMWAFSHAGLWGYYGIQVAVFAVSLPIAITLGAKWGEFWGRRFIYG